jgi:hypothetical protein
LSTPVFFFTVVLFPLIGLAIFFLGYAMPLAFSGKTTFIAAISVASIAAAADTKTKRTPSALN